MQKCFLVFASSAVRRLFALSRRCFGALGQVARTHRSLAWHCVTNILASLSPTFQSLCRMHNPHASHVRCDGNGVAQAHRSLMVLLIIVTRQQVAAFASEFAWWPRPRIKDFLLHRWYPSSLIRSCAFHHLSKSKHSTCRAHLNAVLPAETPTATSLLFGLNRAANHWMNPLLSPVTL